MLYDQQLDDCQNFLILMSWHQLKFVLLYPSNLSVEIQIFVISDDWRFPFLVKRKKIRIISKYHAVSLLVPKSCLEVSFQCNNVISYSICYLSHERSPLLLKTKLTIIIISKKLSGSAKYFPIFERIIVLLKKGWGLNDKLSAIYLQMFLWPCCTTFWKSIEKQGRS